MNDREFVLKWWNQAWTEGLWAAAWGKSIEGLTADMIIFSGVPFFRCS